MIWSHTTSNLSFFPESTSSSLDSRDSRSSMESEPQKNLPILDSPYYLTMSPPSTLQFGSYPPIPSCPPPAVSYAPPPPPQHQQQQSQQQQVIPMPMYVTFSDGVTIVVPASLTGSVSPSQQSPPQGIIGAQFSFVIKPYFQLLCSDLSALSRCVKRSSTSAILPSSCSVFNDDEQHGSLYGQQHVTGTSAVLGAPSGRLTRDRSLRGTLQHDDVTSGLLAIRAAAATNYHPIYQASQFFHVNQPLLHSSTANAHESVGQRRDGIYILLFSSISLSPSSSNEQLSSECRCDKSFHSQSPLLFFCLHIPY